MQKIETGEKIVAVDLFCGAGGMSWGLAQALESIAENVDRPIQDIVELHAVNHWDRAIETHSENHPWAEHYHKPVQQLNPRDVVDGDTEVDILIACPDCTYFSTARGGGPKDRDKRMTPREVLDWVERLDVRNVLFENVPKFEDWGPLDEDGYPITEQEGEYFENWLNALTIEGFNVEYRVLTAADYGDPTSRQRLFVAGRKEAGVEWPLPTHSQDGEADDTEPWRTAANVIDWSDPGESLWVRDLRDGRRSPLVNNTMERIAEGIRRHCDDTLAPFAAVLDDIGQEDEDEPVKYPLPELRETIVPARYAAEVACVRDQPFLVKYYGTLPPQPVTAPLDTVTGTGRNYALCWPERFLLRQQNGEGAYPLLVDEDPVPTVASAGAISRVDVDPFVLPKNGIQRGKHSNPAYDPDDTPLHTVIASDTRQGYLVKPSLIRYSHGGAVKDVDDPVPTITTARGGVFSVAQPYLVPFYNERAGQRPRVHDLEEPAPTIVSSKIPAGVCTAYLVAYYGNGHSQPVTDPLPTQTSKDRFALVVSELFPLGLDIKFRMLKPSELAAAQGFPPSYEFVGNKTETVKQIGNAVPVNLAQSLCEQMLIGDQPTIDSYTGGGTGGVDPDD